MRFPILFGLCDEWLYLLLDRREGYLFMSLLRALIRRFIPAHSEIGPWRKREDEWASGQSSEGEEGKIPLYLSLGHDWRYVRRHGPPCLVSKRPMHRQGCPAVRGLEDRDSNLRNSRARGAAHGGNVGASCTNEPEAGWARLKQTSGE